MIMLAGCLGLERNQLITLMRKKKGVSRNLQKNPKMIEICRLQDQSPKIKGGASLYLVDWQQLFAEPLKAI